MAKIYETKDDFKRDKLDEQAKNLRLRKSEQGNSGMTLLGGSFLAEIYHARSPETRGWLATVGSIMGIVGMIEIVRSWMTGSKAHDLELERERMGPQHVVLPAGAAPDKDCAPCMLKTGRIEPKTLAEHAQTSDTLLGRQ
ncbi:MAG: hypothetical protein EBR02_04180 [Alphaproteobacteria bacterium]|nr:hypothetical protein [Alphaproteobacteria bacterium]